MTKILLINYQINKLAHTKTLQNFGLPLVKQKRLKYILSQYNKEERGPIHDE